MLRDTRPAKRSVAHATQARLAADGLRETFVSLSPSHDGRYRRLRRQCIGAFPRRGLQGESDFRRRGSQEQVWIQIELGRFKPKPARDGQQRDVGL